MQRRPLKTEVYELQKILNRLLSEEKDLETLCKYVPRIVSVATNTVRVQAALEGGREPNSFDEIRRALKEIIPEEEISW